MSAEKLPPDGYELGPGWLTTGTGECLKAGHRDPDRRVRAPYIRDDGLAVCPEHAEEAVAIVRKAAPVCCPRGCKGLNGQHEVFCPGNDETRAANAIVRKAEAPTTRDCGHGLRNCLTCAWSAGRPAEEHLAGTPEAPPEQPSGNAGELLCACGTDRATDAERCPTCASLWDNHEDEECSCYDPNGVDPDDVNKCPFAEAEAPAAPVGEPSEARHLAHAFVTANRLDCEKERPSPEPRPEHFPLCDRLTDVIQRAIDPRDARIAALEAELAARLVERDGWMAAAAKSDTEKAALVSAAVQAERERCAATMDEWLANRLTLADCRQRVGDGTPIKNGDPAP